MKTILAVTDLSAQAEIALKRAAFLARQHGARVEILHLVNRRAVEESLRLFPGPRDWLVEQLMSMAEAELREQISLLDLPPAVKVQLHLREDRTFAAIVQHANRSGADLVVIGVQGRQLFWNPWPQGEAEKVIRKGNRPVLVARKWLREAYERVLVPVDFSEASRQAIQTAMRLAPGARFHFIHVFEIWGLSRLSIAGARKEDIEVYTHNVSQENDALLTRFISEFDLPYDRVRRTLTPGHPPLETLRMAHGWHPDLIAMGTQGRTGLPYVLLGSMAEEIIRRARCDVLVVRAAE